MRGCSSNIDFRTRRGCHINIHGNTINQLGNSLNHLSVRVNKVGAGAAALAALHPLDFNPNDKWNFPAGYDS
jgi:hypothetical protein